MTQCRLRQLTVVRSVFVSSFRFLLCVLVNHCSYRWFLSSLFLCLVPLICLHLVSLFLTLLDFRLPVVVVVLLLFVVDFFIQLLVVSTIVDLLIVAQVAVSWPLC